MDEEKIETAYIPVNFETGINLLGKTVKLLSFIEAIALFAVFGIGSFFIMKKLNIEVATALGISACFGAPPAFLAITGINDEQLHTFVLNVIKFFKRKRVTYYNPRIKKEARAIDFERLGEEETELLPRDKVIKMYDQIKDNIDKKNRDRAIESNAASEDANMYFEDDQGVLSRPIETYTDKELKAIRKAEIALEKKRIKDAKQQERLERKERKKREKEIEDNF